MCRGGGVGRLGGVGRRRGAENEREMHGRTGLKWQQSALMETDSRMRR